MNQRARAYRKDQGLLQGKDHVFKIHRETRDAFNTITLTREKRSFALGDRLIFLKNCDTIKNGMLGTITHIQDTAITLILDDTQQGFTFNPRLYRNFDHGYAPTIHKAQGMTVDRAFVLGSHQMFENLGYVALTRHRKDVHVFGSRLDFWRDDILDVMAKSNHKLLAFDYISEQTAQKLLQQDEKLLDKIFRRLSERIHGLKAVSQESWNRVVESFIGKDPRGVYGALPLAFTENARGQILLDQKRLVSQHSQKDLHYYRAEDVQKVLTPQQTKRLFRDHRPLQNQSAFRKQDNIRHFGPSQDLIMDLQKGRWYNPRDGQRGNLFHYIADSKRCSYSKALAWVGEWAQAPLSVYKRGAKQALYLRQTQEQPLAQKILHAGDQSQRVMVIDNFKIPQENPSQNLQPSSPPKRPHHQAPSYQLEDVERALSPQHIEQLFTENIGPWVNQLIARKSGSTLRFGDSGGFAVNLKKGLWFSHYDDQKGNLFHFIASSKGYSYSEAVTWVGEWVQAPQSTSLRNEQPQRLQKAREAQDQENQERILKAQQMAEKAWTTSLPLTHTLAERYLRETRSIQTAPLDKIQGEGDLRFAPQSYTEGRSVPALLAFGRTPQGKLICYQAIYLDAQTATKASGLQVPKRTHGVLKGAVVTIQKDLPHKGITFVAEGIETALSLKEAGLKGEILATLGQSNMAHVTTTNPYIVLCGDYDGKNQDRNRGKFAKIQATLESKGPTVYTLWPATTGLQKIDFNDMLKTDGIQKIHDLFKGLPHDFKTPQKKS